MKDYWIARIKGSARHDKNALIEQLLTDKSVLDVGCVGQDFGYQSENWLHGRVSKVAKRLVGVDTNLQGIDELRRHNPGYTVYSPGELKEKNMLFDYIVMADVIEHVSNTVEFLNFYSQFLSSEGKIIITTPNPFSANQFFCVLFYGQPSFHPEHTCYIDPINMLELADRANLKLAGFYWLSFYSRATKWHRKLTRALSHVLIAVRKYYAPSYMCILEAK